MERLFGLDIGDKRIGIAISDDLGMLASPLTTLQSKGWGPDVRALQTLAAANGVQTMICGMPYTPSGQVGTQAKKTYAFGAQLEAAGFYVIYWDESFTSFEAESIVRRREKIDQTAAAIILQRYLDETRRNPWHE